MKKFFIILLIIIAVVVIDEKPWRSDTDFKDTDTRTRITTVFTGKYNTITDEDDNKGTTNKKTCYACNGSKKCHVCSGKGTFYCDSIYCNSGDCNRCVAGVYDHGSYASSCLVCDGKGYCKTCKGTTRYNCSICSGTGKCTHCD